MLLSRTTVHCPVAISRRHMLLPRKEKERTIVGTNASQRPGRDASRHIYVTRICCDREPVQFPKRATAQKRMGCCLAQAHSSRRSPPR
jgi:hypothetical protein